MFCILNFKLQALNPKFQSKGFTLIELLVVLAIITILSLMVLPRFQVAGQQHALLRSAYKLAQDLRRVQEMTTSGYEFQNIIPEGGYGIYLSLTEPGHYILFADCNNNQYFTPGNVCQDPYNNRFSEQVEKIELDKRIKIKEISPSPLHIVFKYPDPLVFISGGADDIAKITLSLRISPERIKTIEINTAGMIDVK